MSRKFPRTTEQFIRTYFDPETGEVFPENIGLYPLEVELNRARNIATNVFLPQHFASACVVIGLLEHALGEHDTCTAIDSTLYFDAPVFVFDAFDPES